MLEKGVKKCDNKKYDHDVNDCRSQLLRHFLRLFGFLSRPWHMLFLPLSISLTLFFSFNNIGLIDGLSWTGAFKITFYC